MYIGACKVRLTAEWVSSLKEKRMVVRSLVEKTKNKFNVSVAEVDDQDIWQSVVLGFACVSNDARHADAMAQNVLRFIEGATDAVAGDVVIEVLRID